MILDVERGGSGDGQNNTQNFKNVDRIPSIFNARRFGVTSIGGNLESHLHQKPQSYSTESVKAKEANQCGSPKSYCGGSSSKSCCSNPCKRQLTWFKNNASYCFFIFIFGVANIALFAMRVWQYRQHNIFEILARAFGKLF